MNVDGIISILVVEDNPGDLALVQLLLSQSGMTHEIVHRPSLSEIEGIDNDVDVVLLDLGLPDSQGMHTLEQVRSRLPDPAIVVLSGIVDQETGVQAVSRGAQDYLVKGRIGGEGVCRSIRYAIERHRLQRQVAEMQEQLLEVERTRVVAETAVAAAHRIFQPLTVVMGNADMLELVADVQNPKIKELIDGIQDAGERIQQIVSRMRNVKSYSSQPYVEDIRMVDFEGCSGKGDGDGG